MIFRGIFILFCLFGSLAYAKLSGELTIGAEYESNIYFQNSNPTSSSVIVIDPKVKWNMNTKSLYWNAQADIHQRQYSADPKVSKTQYNLGTDLYYRNKEKWILGVLLSTERKANPLLEKASTADAPTKNENEIMLEWKYNWTKKSTFKLGLGAETAAYLPETFKYLNSAETEIDFTYAYRFLPETELLFGFRTGTKIFADGRYYYDSDTDTELVKFDNKSTEVYGGIVGRLTKYTSIRASFGVKNIAYTQQASFSEPVFSVEFTDQISPKDIIIAGYDYRAEDSSFTNYVLEQDMYIAYSRVLRDTFIYHMRLSYIYYSYSQPQRREDQRINAKFNVDYVFMPKWLLSAGVHLDLLSSDAIDTQLTTDRAASYGNNQIYVNIKRSF